MPASRTTWAGSLLAVGVMALTLWTARVPVQGASDCVGKPYGHPGCPSLQVASTSSGRPPHCGDTNVQTSEGEECDLGQFNGQRECSPDCKLLFCGDGIVSPQMREECEPQVQEVYVDRNGVLTVERQFVTSQCGKYCTPPVLNKKGEVIAGCTYAFGPACTSSATSVSASALSVMTASAGASTVPSSVSAASVSVLSSARVSAASSAAPVRSSVSVCGNGILEGAEQCDDGSLNSDIRAGACRTNCTIARCGDAVVDPHEQCDDGNDDDTDGCSNTCQLAVCGNGIVEGSEECDDGNRVNDDLCSNTCTLARCGDGIRQAGEQCDDGSLNSDTRPGACRTSCALPRCGDSVVDPGEQCDAGVHNSNTQPGACRMSCTLPRCGDGVVDPGEECDGGANCTPACRLATLGATVPHESQSSSSAATAQASQKLQDGSMAVLIGIVAASSVVAGILGYLMRGEIARLLGIRKPKKDIDDLTLDEIEMPWQKL